MASLNIANIITGAKKYIKNDAVFGSNANTPGTYYLATSGSTLWLTYRLPGDKGALNDKLAAKADDYALKSAVNEKPKEADKYAGTTNTVYVNVF